MGFDLIFWALTVIFQELLGLGAGEGMEVEEVAQNKNHCHDLGDDHRDDHDHAGHYHHHDHGMIIMPHDHHNICQF